MGCLGFPVYVALVQKALGTRPYLGPYGTWICALVVNTWWLYFAFNGGFPPTTRLFVALAAALSVLGSIGGILATRVWRQHTNARVGRGRGSDQLS